MTEPYEVFVSHAATKDSFAAQLKDAVWQGLADRGMKPFVADLGIVEGCEWYHEVVSALLNSQAAVLLLDERALASDWVRREVNILMWRRAIGFPLDVFPVLLDGISSSRVKRAGMAEVGPIQYLRAEAGHTAEYLAERVLSHFVDVTAAVGCDDPMSNWIKRLARYLKDARDRGLLGDVAKALQVPMPGLDGPAAPVGAAVRLAHQVLVAEHGRIEAALVELQGGGLGDDVLRRMITDVQPLWVHPEAAPQVLPDGPPKNMTVLLNTRKAETARQYIQRATCVARMGYQTQGVGDLPTGEDPVRERYDRWQDAVWREFFEAEEAEDRFLPEDLADRVHYLIINRQCMPDGDFATAVRMLHATFPWLIVVVTTGHDEAGDEVAATFGSVVRPQPPIKTAKEQTAFLRNRRIRDLIDY